MEKKLRIFIHNTKKMPQQSQNPYLAWEVDPNSFPYEKPIEEQIAFLVNFAVLAPSSHNTQPWLFRIKENICELYADEKRALKHSDPEDRQLFISLGAALANLIVAAQFYDLNTKIIYCPHEKDTMNEKEKRLAARIEFSKSAPAQQDTQKNLKELFPGISERHTNRNFYLDRPIDDGFFTDCRNYIDDQNLKIHFIQEKNKKEKIAQTVVDASRNAHDDPKFRKELFYWVRSNYTKAPDGMPGFGMGIPGPISIIAPYMIRYLKVGKSQSKKDGKAIIGSPLVVIISTKEDTPVNWLKAGELAEKIMLKAATQDIQTAINAAAIEIGDHWKKIQEVLKTDFRPQVLFRAGYAASKMPHSPRRSSSEVII